MWPVVEWPWFLLLVLLLDALPLACLPAWVAASLLVTPLLQVVAKAVVITAQRPLREPVTRHGRLWRRCLVTVTALHFEVQLYEQRFHVPKLLEYLFKRAGHKVYV